jgi:hypothetical protein
VRVHLRDAHGRHRGGDRVHHPVWKPLRKPISHSQPSMRQSTRLPPGGPSLATGAPRRPSAASRRCGSALVLLKSSASRAPKLQILARPRPKGRSPRRRPRPPAGRADAPEAVPHPPMPQNWLAGSISALKPAIPQMHAVVFER